MANIHLSGLEEFNQDCCHVVASKFFHGVLGEQPVEKVLHELGWVLLMLALLHQLGDQQLAIVYISFPNAIASHNDELVIGMARHLLHVRMARDHLLLVGKAVVALVLEVAFIKSERYRWRESGSTHR